MLRGIGWYLFTDVSGQLLRPIYYRVKKLMFFQYILPFIITGYQIKLSNVAFT